MRSFYAEGTTHAFVLLEDNIRSEGLDRKAGEVLGAGAKGRGRAGA